jgi:hypothetical protein
VKAALRANAHARPSPPPASRWRGASSEAREHIGRARALVAAYSVTDFLSAFSFTPDMRALYTRVAGTIGFV